MAEEDDVAATVGGLTSGSWLRRRYALLLLGFVLAGASAFFFHRARRQAEDPNATVALRLRLHTEELAIRRRACGLPEGVTLHEAMSIQGACQAAIVSGWRAPGSVVFPGMFDEDGSLESPDGCVTTYRSWVVGPGPDGSNVRQPYVCTFDPRTGIASIELLDR